MNQFKEQRNRQIIPRWLTFYENCRLIPPQVIDTSWMGHAVSLKELALKEDRWTADRRLVYAIDLVCSAHVVGKAEGEAVRDAATFILEGTEVSPTVRETALHLLGRQDQPFETSVLSVSDIRRKIHELKRSAYGRFDPFLFLDMAFHYALVAQNESAVRCVEIALALGDNNPIVLRTVARFYLHAEKAPERALHVLRKSPATPHHPLLLASEISISEAFGLKSPFRKTGARFLSKDWHPWLLGELAGTIGTLELKAESVRKAKDAFRIARRCPDENTFAQLQWVSSKFLASVADESHRPAAAFEADAISHFHSERYDEALVAAKLWMRFQPFTARPAILASHIANVALEDFGTGAKILKQALTASPTSFILINNLAFALASEGQVHEAEGVMRRVNPCGLPPVDVAVAMATSGLIAFRRGDMDRGRILYRDAILELNRLGDKNRALIAEIYWAREELAAGTDASSAIVENMLNKTVGLKGYRVVDRLRRDASKPG